MIFRIFFAFCNSFCGSWGWGAIPSFLYVYLDNKTVCLIDFSVLLENRMYICQRYVHTCIFTADPCTYGPWFEVDSVLNCFVRILIKLWIKLFTKIESFARLWYECRNSTYYHSLVGRFTNIFRTIGFLLLFIDITYFKVYCNKSSCCFWHQSKFLIHKWTS